MEERLLVMWEKTLNVQRKFGNGVVEHGSFGPHAQLVDAVEELKKKLN